MICSFLPLGVQPLAATRSAQDFLVVSMTLTMALLHTSGPQGKGRGPTSRDCLGRLRSAGYAGTGSDDQDEVQGAARGAGACACGGAGRRAAAAIEG
jgi:hypothetical protein